MSRAFLDSLKYDAAGLVSAVIQDADTGEVLMFAFTNREALERTLAAGRMHFYSRSRNKIWLKGEESGHVQDVVEIRTDCDRDALLIKVRQTSGACHTGFRSCFSWKLVPDTATAAVPAARDGAVIPAAKDGAAVPAAKDGAAVPAVKDGAAVPAVKDGAAVPAVKDGTVEDGVRMFDPKAVYKK